MYSYDGKHCPSLHPLYSPCPADVKTVLSSSPPVTFTKNVLIATKQTDETVPIRGKRQQRRPVKRLSRHNY